MLRLLLAALISLVPPLAAAQDRANTILVMDGSGSMWGQIDGVNKIVIAREVVGGLLDSFPADQNLGLTVYGHRERGNCADIETVVPPGAGTLGQIRAAVNAINPRGKTPMTDAVIAAAEALRYTEEVATVVLVSDGIETCNPDPCAAARALEEAGINFTAHVVGFDVTDPEALAQMQCLAAETGGRFLTASNASELTDALSTVVAEPVYVPQTVQIVGVLQPGGAEIAEPIAWNILPSAGANFDGSGPGFAIDLPADAYDLVGTRLSDGAEAGLIFEVAALEADQGQRVEVIFPEPAPDPVEVRFRAVIGSEDGPDAYGPVLWTLASETEGTILDDVEGNPIPELLTEGSHTVVAYWVAEEQSSDIRQFIVGRTPREIVIVFEEPRETATLTAPASAPAGSMIEVGWNGPNEADDFVGIGAADAVQSLRWRNYTYTRDGNPLTLLMPPEPGPYVITYFKGDGNEPLGAVAIEATPLEMALSAPSEAVAGSTIEVGWTGPDYRDDYIGIGRLDATRGDQWRNFTYTREGNPLQLQVPPEPGTYVIRYFLRQDRTELASTTIEVTAPEASVTAPATAIAGSTIEVGWVGPDQRDDYIGIGRLDATRGDQWRNFTYTREGNPVQLVVPPAPGRYTIRYFLSQDRTELASTTLEVTAPEVSLTAPATAVAGDTIEVGWVGPDYRDNYIGIGRADATRGDRWETFAYTREGQPLRVRVPATAGAYRVTYFLNQERTAMTSVPLTVTTPEANLVAPARAAAGSVVEIGWTGPDYRDDYIGIGRADATRGDRWQSFRYTRDGTPAKLQLPDQPGAYVIRYFMNLDRTVLAEVPIVLE